MIPSNASIGFPDNGRDSGGAAEVSWETYETDWTARGDEDFLVGGTIEDNDGFTLTLNDGGLSAAEVENGVGIKLTTDVNAASFLSYLVSDLLTGSYSERVAVRFWMLLASNPLTANFQQFQVRLGEGASLSPYVSARDIYNAGHHMEIVAAGSSYDPGTVGTPPTILAGEWQAGGAIASFKYDTSGSVFPNWSAMTVAPGYRSGRSVSGDYRPASSTAWPLSAPRVGLYLGPGGTTDFTLVVERTKVEILELP